MTKSRLIIITACLLGLGTVIMLNYSGNSLKTKPSYKMSSMYQIQMVTKEGNTVKWELSAEKAEFPRGNTSILLASVGLKINNDPEIRLTSSSGVYTVRDGDLRLNEPVEMNVKDAFFRTKEMSWDNSEGTLTTDNNVEFTGRNFIIKGKGLVAKSKDQKVRILSDVKAVFNL